MKTFITNLNMNGFKSFGRKSALDFSPGLNAIIGPNGSGKSNCLDALCFILGRMSSKDLRAENFADLIFKRKTQTAGEAETSITLDNSGGVFPYASKSITLVRRIKKDGTTQYKINSKNSTRQEVIELMSLVRVQPDGHNIILQGDIARFVDMKPIEKRQLIEEIAGISTYEFRKQKALAELGKVDEKLKESQIILNEKESYMTNLAQEKKGAEQHRSMTAELSSLQAAEIKLRMDSANAKKNKTLAEIEKRENLMTNSNLEIEIASKKITQLQQRITALDKEIGKKGGEESLALQKEIEELRIKAEKSRTIVSLSREQVGKTDTAREGLEKNLKDIELKIKEKEKERSELEKQKQKITSAEQAEKSGDTSELESIDEKVSALDKEIGKLNAEFMKLSGEKSTLSANIKIFEHKLKTAEAGLAEADKYDSRKIEKKYKDLLEEIGKLASQDSRLALELGELRKELQSKEGEQLKTKAQSSVQEILLRDRAIKELFSQKKKISGILGTVAELGKVDKEYSEALRVAAGNRMKFIVVDSQETAIKCLQVLKGAKAGIATFLPMDKLIVDAVSEVPKKSGIIGLASELITCESKYKRVFQYIFRNTLIVDDIPAARSLGISKHRMVTLEGDVFEPTGAITGGFREKDLGVSFEKNEFQGALVKLEADIAVITKNISELESKRQANEQKIYALRTEKSELEGKVEFTKGLGKDLDSLEEEITGLKKDISNSESEIEKCAKGCEKLDKEIKEKSAKRDVLKSKLFGSGKKDLQELLTKKSEIESHLQSAIATMENVFAPEKENLTKKLNGLEKEKKDFEKQIGKEESALAVLDKEIEAKEGEQNKFTSKLKEIIAEKNEASLHLREAEKKYNEAQLETGKIQQEKNFYAIEKAQHEAEFSTLKQEMEPFANVTPAEVKNIEDAKRRARTLSEKITQLGNINMRALEIFEAVQQEYENLAGKVNKLTSEKNDIVSVINEIETKKKETFMNTYDSVALKFKEIHSKVAEKNHAILELENNNNPFEGGVTVKIIDEIGRRTSLAALSGGEKTLVALSLIFAVQAHDPAPFYLLDEIDAALDKVNSEKVAKLLREYSEKAQIVIITHNDAVISEADSVYGVSMTKEKWSNVVSVKL
ncbi:MAG TPA: chromosome segregation protein SMC [Nanoarchaeota archaeon]|nr:chromosome segregation protein SMC [Nanoarchaeota archaeon]